MYVSMKEMLVKANQGNYAIMAINCFNLETARTVIAAAEEENSPIIVNLYQDHLLYHCDSELITPLVKVLAGRVNVPVALNFDHGQDLAALKKAIDDGFSSVMVDASRFDLAGNIAMTREIVDYANPHGVSVEGEIGCMGATDGAAFTEASMYTDPIAAARFAKETGIDALAISIGSSHGNYPNGMIPDFDFERLKAIKAATQLPLVLHGGSGSGEKNIRSSVLYGINKINVGCDFMNASIASVKAALANNPAINYFDLVAQTEKSGKEIIKYYIRLAGSNNQN